MMKNFELSVLDLAPVKQGKTILNTFEDSLDLARTVESLGYKRFWLAEHHNMKSIASSATSVLIGYIAGGTEKIRVGSGGVMLPNHSSLVIAEQFGTLETLYPGRIDLGVGRAPGTDGITAKALGRNPANINEQFPRQIQELQYFFSENQEDAPIRAVPGEGLNIPIYILGSSTDSAWLASELGLPYAFAAHFAPDQMEMAFKIYHQNFRPSEYLAEPYTIACVNGIAADTDEQAQKLSNTLYMAFTNIVRDNRQPFGPPPENMDEIWNPMEKAYVQKMLRVSFIGGKEKIAEELSNFQKRVMVDEIMITAHIYDHEARKHSYSIIKEAAESLA
ncbi:luciferase family oxidoreductase, group 1 [Cruoricaptor ignavus]|uniref:Luciferase-like monooxygenase n=2 Tax=Cruoricaptor ignavus TaxID=1118202 RepID=A0A1M6ACL5_9FLAO|nr:luciferase family oxidoreductase, group 1 [Cruoricaptor ignavus]